MRTDQSLQFPGPTPAEQSVGTRHFEEGVSQSGSEANDLFLATATGGFEKTSLVSGLDGLADGRSFALLDIDEDGWLDVVTVNANEPFLELHRNRIGALAPGRRSIALEFEGGQRSGSPEPGWSNRTGIGVRVMVELDDATILRQLQAGEGLAAQNSQRMRIGIGDAPSAKRIHVRWPSGRTETLEDVPAGALIRLEERSAAGVENTAS